MKTLILGGARSGKSGRAAQLAEASGREKIYLATAESGDAEMAQRIAKHRDERGDTWTTVEEPRCLSRALARYNDPRYYIVVDCLTLWLSHCLSRDCWPAERDRLLATLPTLEASIALVSNEVGSGVVPLGPLSRQFVDEAGWLHQRLARAVDAVELIVAGLPLTLK